MRYRPAFPVSGRISKILALALLASVAAGCSSTSTRLAENPFSNPFRSRNDSIATGSIKSSRVQPPSDANLTTGSVARRVTSAPLPAPGTSQLKQLQSSAVDSAKAKAGSTVAKSIPGWSAKGGSPVTLGAGESVETVANRYGVPAAAILSVNGLGSSSQAVPGQQLIIPAYSAISGGGSSSMMDAAKGATIKAAPALVPKLGGKSLSELKELPQAYRFDKNYLALGPDEPVEDSTSIDPLKLLGFAPSEPVTQTIAPAKKAVVAAPKKKVRSVSNIAAPIQIKKAPVVVAAKPADIKPAAPKPSTPKPVLTAAPVAPKPAKIATVVPAIQKANSAQKIKPAAKLASAVPVAQPVSSPVAKKQSILAAAPKKQVIRTVAVTKPVVNVAPKQVAVAKPAPKAKAVVVASAASVVAPKREVAKPDAKKSEALAPTADSIATGSLPPNAEHANIVEDRGVFRWPAKGKIISSFGSKDTAGINNGINISMPEGTPVKAAENGVVAYAGDDVKKFGKLVLIKHENGFVSAYAHNGELDVKKGDAVKRGQIIAKSGSTGDVASPQLHFQLRKGEQPVDPTKLMDAS